MADDKKPEEKKGTPLKDRLLDAVGAVLDGLQELLNPPRPVRVPAGPRRPR